jgi:hypothetical protein
MIPLHLFFSALSTASAMSLKNLGTMLFTGGRLRDIFATPVSLLISRSTTLLLVELNLDEDAADSDFKEKLAFNFCNNLILVILQKSF